jgi:hypothetical protein
VDERIERVTATLRDAAEELADLAYDALAARIEGDVAAAELERRLASARRAVLRALSALDRSGDR